MLLPSSKRVWTCAGDMHDGQDGLYWTERRRVRFRRNHLGGRVVSVRTGGGKTVGQRGSRSLRNLNQGESPETCPRTEVETVGITLNRESRGEFMVNLLFRKYRVTEEVSPGVD